MGRECPHGGRADTPWAVTATIGLDLREENVFSHGFPSEPTLGWLCK